jgi:hypothetical protein
MKPAAKLGIATLLVAMAAGAAHKSTSKAEKPVESAIDGPAMFVNGSTAQEWFEACQAEKQENERLQSALKAEKAKALGWYKQSSQYKAKTTAQQVSGHWETRCNGNSCQRVWVVDKPAKEQSKPVAKSTQEASLSADNGTRSFRPMGKLRARFGR